MTHREYSQGTLWIFSLDHASTWYHLCLIFYHMVHEKISNNFWIATRQEMVTVRDFWENVAAGYCVSTLNRMFSASNPTDALTRAFSLNLVARLPLTYGLKFRMCSD